jgi:hypothetical protein
MVNFFLVGAVNVTATATILLLSLLLLLLVVVVCFCRHEIFMDVVKLPTYFNKVHQ